MPPGTVLIPPTGLSPRVRGNRSGFLVSEDGRGSIPVCAGEPRGAVGGGAVNEVYPRVCGGTRVRGIRGGYIQGSIPACAGEPRSCISALSESTVYPRVCGGTVMRTDDGRAWYGLSPRVRGNLIGWSDIIDPWGSIPACAGEPTSRTATYLRRTVYPRVCGGTDGILQLHTGGPGLSPRVRGNLTIGEPLAAPARSIPACAGEPGRCVGAVPLLAVYPRVCGGTSASAV